jgi:hypothetical protein
MRLIVTSVALVLSVGAALAQTGSITPAPSASAPGKAAPIAVSPAARTGKSAVAEAKAECMRMWDAGTHMSRQEWSRTCERIQTRLDNLKIENLDLMGTGMRKKAGVGKQSNIILPNRMD